MLRKILIVLVGLTLPLSTLVAYAWWDQIQKRVDIVDIEIGYGSRIQLTNLTNLNQGKLVPKNSIQANQDGYTSSFAFSFKVSLTDDLNQTNLGIEFSNIRLIQDQHVELYSKDNTLVSCLDLTLDSINQSLQIIGDDPYLLQGSYVYFLIPHGNFQVPESRFELKIEINESLLDETCSTYIQNSIFSFDLMVEAQA